jgi:drug/metabolite transporter (DMT)-like permease
MPISNYRFGLICVTVSAIAWSTAGLFTRMLELDSWTMLAWRGLFGAFGIAAVMVAMQGWRSLAQAGSLGRPGWVFAIVSALGMICFITSLRYTTVAHVAVIYATAPLLAAGIGWLWLGERPRLFALIASLAAIAGVAIMAGLSAEGSLFGDLLAFGMTACLAVMITMSRKYPDIPFMAAAGLSSLISGLVCLPMVSSLSVTGQELAILAAFGLVNSAVGLALFTLGARYLPPVETALIGALDAPLAPLWVWLVFNETPGAATAYGGAIVFIAVAAFILASARTNRQAIAAL